MVETGYSGEESRRPPPAQRDDAALTEAVRHVDVIHTSLAGMTAIVAVLLFAVALPVFGLQPVSHPIPFGVLASASFIGIGGLYLLNYRVHQHVTNQARLTEVLVNSLGQGFLVFDQNGVCGNVYSQACLDLLETVPAGKKVSEVLRIPEEQIGDFNDWIAILFQPDHALSFDDVIKFLPSFFPHAEGRRVTLVYRPIYRRGGPLAKVVIIATDQTEEYEAREQAKNKQIFAEMICRIFKDRNQFQATVAHVRHFLDVSGAPDVRLDQSEDFLRQLHTLKAAVKQFNMLELGDVIHNAEADLRNEIITDDKAFRRELKVGRQKIADALLAVTDEVSSIIGTEHEWRRNVREIEEKDLYDFACEMERSKVTNDLMEAYLARIAAVPIRDCFQPLAHELQELASMLDKQVKPLAFVGENPRVLTKRLQELFFSLTHLSRNIMEHGIEPPVTRMARGKDPAGLVTVEVRVVHRTENEGSWVRLVISDDGGGIDPTRVRAKLAVMDPEGSWRFEDDQTVIQRIFMWGFSTKDEISALSGRGVGMEAVEREVKLLGGNIRVSSELYRGARFEIMLPYKLDINEIM